MNWMDWSFEFHRKTSELNELLRQAAAADMYPAIRVHRDDVMYSQVLEISVALGMELSAKNPVTNTPPLSWRRKVGSSYELVPPERKEIK